MARSEGSAPFAIAVLLKLASCSVTQSPYGPNELSHFVLCRVIQLRPFFRQASHLHCLLPQLSDLRVFGIEVFVMIDIPASGGPVQEAIGEGANLVRRSVFLVQGFEHNECYSEEHERK